MPQILYGRPAADRSDCSRWAALAPLQAPHQQHFPSLCAALAACHMLQRHTQGLHWHAAVPTLVFLLDPSFWKVWHASALVAAGLSSRSQAQDRGQITQNRIGAMLVCHPAPAGWLPPQKEFGLLPHQLPGGAAADHGGLHGAEPHLSAGAGGTGRGMAVPLCAEGHSPCHRRPDH